MTTETRPAPRKFFLNLPVRDLPRSVAFFTELGFAFNRNFTDETCTCMIVGEEASVMLMVEERFKGFTNKQVCDTRTHHEALLCLSAASRAEVDELIARAVAAGGTRAQEPEDHGFMYGCSFYDLDGHGWEIMWMDPSASQPA